LLFSYDHSKYKVGIFTGCIYVQSIFILIVLNLTLINDMACTYLKILRKKIAILEKTSRKQNLTKTQFLGLIPLVLQ
jgi:hypothetical protein